MLSLPPVDDPAEQLGQGMEAQPDRVPERQVVAVEAEVHRYALGSPSSRSAAMLRWISLVPA